MKHQKNNFQLMMKLIEDTFATRNDPGQIHVTPEEMKKLERLHPSTLSELADENGPLIWVLMIPTTSHLVHEFVRGAISEKQLLEQTPVGVTYDCIYLCSATTLPEIRGKGETKKLCIKAIREISKDYPIETLCVWPFTNEGDRLAEAVAKECQMNLIRKE